MGAIVSNKLSFQIVELNSCSLLGVMDTSYYSSEVFESPTLQVLIPGYDEVVELNYYPNEVTILNSGNLGLSNIADDGDYLALPDGLWTIKISICPFEDNWFQKQFFRTCQIECKFYKAFLNLELNKCETCYNEQKAVKLNTAWMYIQGVKANVADCNFEKASELYSIANKILDDLIECDCG